METQPHRLAAESLKWLAAFGGGELRMRLMLLPQFTQDNCIGEVKAIRLSGSSLCF